eukprot:TRINITY_DN4602_c0_g1_i1.p1 TRINITY_DN4602_c0_g1~~TRINITY_DN4602_c0_g1_i1.p1  ORF type:complete len:408 (-),score=137.22 TRINITY_DN4602_c0_g1_i1:204-1427(-)
MTSAEEEKQAHRLRTLEAFVEDECIPAEKVFDDQVKEIQARTGSRWSEVPAVMDQLKSRARALGLWNLFMPPGHPGTQGVSVSQYAALSEVMGRSTIAPEACNCSAPDTGNMEVLAQYGSAAQQAAWLPDLLEGRIRSAFLMTEPETASSDATNIACRIRRRGDKYVVTGRKWWSTGAMDPRCRLFIVMGRMEGAEWDARPIHQRHTMLLVPARSPGVTLERALEVFGYDDAPHGHAEVTLRGVEVSADAALLLGEGRGFEIAQGRLGPGRVHHCMRALGLAERALTALVRRSRERVAFGRPLCDHDMVRRSIADSRMELDQARHLVLDCARKLERSGGAKGAMMEVAMIKVVVPNVACAVIDRAIQVHGGMGVCQDTFLAAAYAHMRTLRIADGPDEVRSPVILQH